MIKALIALGNPGKEYEKTYHNVGVFVAGELQRLAQEQGRQLAVYEPTTFMNISGPAVASWMKMNNLSRDQVLVVHDEGDLLRGEYKIAHSGGSAGHNGVASVLASFGTDEFSRLRIGIRDPHEQERKKALDFVLNQWSKADEVIFTDVAARAWSEIAPLMQEAA